MSVLFERALERSSADERELLEYGLNINGRICSFFFGVLFAGSLGGITIWLYAQGTADGLAAEDIGHHLVLLSVFLPGFEVSPGGALVGTFWGALLGMLVGQVFHRTWANSLRLELSLKPDLAKTLVEARHLQLTPVSIGLAIGLPAALLLIIATMLLVWRGTAHESEHAMLLALFLPGYSVSLWGALVGAVQVLVIALACAAFFCWLYNTFAGGVSTQEVSRAPEHYPLTPEQRRQKHVVVLGAGPAGLATAHELSAQGVDVTVLERNTYVGGLCNTVQSDGYKFDLGGHRWFTKNEDLNRWFRRLMEGEIVMVERILSLIHISEPTRPY